MNSISTDIIVAEEPDLVNGTRRTFRLSVFFWRRSPTFDTYLRAAIPDAPYRETASPVLINSPRTGAIE